MNFSYIIGYRHSEERFKNFTRTLDWLLTFPNSEIIIVEQDSEKRFLPQNERIKHFFVKNDSAYNRSWAFNVGLKYCSHDSIAFGDSDLIMDNSKFEESLKSLEHYDVVSPYKSVLDLFESESDLPISELDLIPRPGRGETDNQKINLCGGIVLFKKDSINKIGGWNEDFNGWGGEDDFQTMKVNLFGLKQLEMPYRCYHLYHERPAPDFNLYKRNISILQTCQQINIDQLKSYISHTMKDIGNENKFSK